MGYCHGESWYQDLPPYRQLVSSCPSKAPRSSQRDFLVPKAARPPEQPRSRHCWITLPSASVRRKITHSHGIQYPTQVVEHSMELSGSKSANASNLPSRYESDSVRSPLAALEFIRPIHYLSPWIHSPGDIDSMIAGASAVHLCLKLIHPGYHASLRTYLCRMTS